MIFTSFKFSISWLNHDIINLKIWTARRIGNCFVYRRTYCILSWIKIEELLTENSLYFIISLPVNILVPAPLHLTSYRQHICTFQLFLTVSTTSLERPRRVPTLTVFVFDDGRELPDASQPYAGPSLGVKAPFTLFLAVHDWMLLLMSTCRCTFTTGDHISFLLMIWCAIVTSDTGQKLSKVYSWAVSLARVATRYLTKVSTQDFAYSIYSQLTSKDIGRGQSPIRNRVTEYHNHCVSNCAVSVVPNCSLYPTTSTSTT